MNKKETKSMEKKKQKQNMAKRTTERKKNHPVLQRENGQQRI